MNGTTDSKFQLIHKSSYLKLRSILYKRLPVSFQIYNAIQLYVTSTAPEEDPEFKFYSYDGTIDEHSIIVFFDCMRIKKTDEGIPIIFLSVHTPNILTAEIAEEFVKSFPRSDDVLSFAVERNSSPLVIQALLNKGYILKIQSCNMQYMTNEILETDHVNINNIDLSNYIVKFLEPEEAKIVAGHWKYGSWEHPEYYTRRCIEKHPSCGVYSKETGELMSWAICYNFGSIGMLFTPEKFRGQGLSKIVITFLNQKMKERGLHPGTGVEPRNFVSANLMAKFGFKHTHSNDFIFTK